MRTCTVNGRTGIIAAQNGKAGTVPTRVFVLFDGDAPNEPNADWFDYSAVLPTGVVQGSF
jgi:hypothetical protein